MKWTNKGHEFDNVYETIKDKRGYYLFGAGDYGALFLSVIKEELPVLGFIDNDVQKQQQSYMGYPVYPLSSLEELDTHVGVILTISQFARASAQAQLESIGIKKDVQYYMIEEFLSVYYVYKYDQVYMSSISFLPSTICNLNCRHCLNFNPFTERYFKRELNELKKDIDLFFNCIDRVMIFHLSGGEPMLYSSFADIVEYIDVNYGDRIDIFRTVTNGTIVPSEKILEVLSKSRVELTVDDYREAVPEYNSQFDRLIEKLDQYHINYVINKANAWVDLAPEHTDYSGHCEAYLVRHFDKCCQTWHELRNGKLYMCNYASYAQVAGLVEVSEEECYNLSGSEGLHKKELVEFRLGYSEKGYTEFCKKCRGFTVENNEAVKPAVQVKKGCL